MEAREWKEVIVEWSKLISAQTALDDFDGRRPFDPVHGYGQEGASESAIKTAEARLGTTLPPSYREFLKATNGLQQPIESLPTTGGDFWAVEDIDWFRVRNADWIKAWRQEENEDDDVPDEEYLDYGPDQDSCNLRTRYLENALEISHDGDAGIYLLIPDVKDKDGEWEAWHFTSWMPGAARFRSFEEMLKALRDNLIDDDDDDRAYGF